MRQGREPIHLTGGPEWGGCSVTRQEVGGIYYDWQSGILAGLHGKRFRIKAVRIYEDTTIPLVVYPEFDLDNAPPVLYYD